jgi:hypothetical protein
MSRRWALGLISAALLVLAGLVVAYPQIMIAPGPLAPGHAKLTDDCFACHVPLRGATAAKCISCHAVAAIGVTTTTGAAVQRKPSQAPFHQALTTQDCMACHSDHAGPSLTHRSNVTFSHALLKGGAKEDCAGCHAAPTTQAHRSFGADCARCHVQDHWKPATFDHAKFFVLDGDHNAPCATCHLSDDFSKYTCYGCHEHQPDRIRSKHVKEGIPTFENCASCHRSAHGEREREHGDRGSREKKRERKD